MQRNGTAVFCWLPLRPEILIEPIVQAGAGPGAADPGTHRQVRTLAVRPLSLVGEAQVNQRHEHVIMSGDTCHEGEDKGKWAPDPSGPGARGRSGHGSGLGL